MFYEFLFKTFKNKFNRTPMGGQPKANIQSVCFKLLLDSFTLKVQLCVFGLNLSYYETCTVVGQCTNDTTVSWHDLLQQQKDEMRTRIKLVFTSFFQLMSELLNLILELLNILQSASFYLEKCRNLATITLLLFHSLSFFALSLMCQSSRWWA